MQFDFSRRLGFLVNEVGRLYGKRFDQLARQGLGLSRAQCRLIAAVATHEGVQPLSQAELALRLDLTAMGVATLCDRMQAGGWLLRVPRPGDRRTNGIALQAAAHTALEAAMKLGDGVQAQALEGLSADECTQLLALLRRVHANLQGAMEGSAEVSVEGPVRATADAPKQAGG